jgi:hypothetical protein
MRGTRQEAVRLPTINRVKVSLAAEAPPALPQILDAWQKLTIA